MILHGDCVERMAELDADSIDAIVTDPPYGLEFMGKEWDRLGAVAEHPDDGEGPWGRTARIRYGRDVSSAQEWHGRWAAAAPRVAKPGAYLLAFGGTRTVHRMTVAIEDAGWTIRDVLVWAYAQGFPKSKASLKPAWEPIVLARKPGRSTDLQIDAARISSEGNKTFTDRSRDDRRAEYRTGTSSGAVPTDVGRWPANVVLTDPIFDGGVDGVIGGGMASAGAAWSDRERGDGRGILEGQTQTGRIALEPTTYSRFFLVPKASRSDREPILSDLPERETGVMAGSASGALNKWGHGLPPKRRNTHPTVKPVDLMRHLVRLVTPPGGTVLDPFLGSGTTGIAAELEGYAWLGIEREAEYVAIAQARLAWVQRGLGLAL